MGRSVDNLVQLVSKLGYGKQKKKLIKLWFMNFKKEYLHAKYKMQRKKCPTMTKRKLNSFKAPWKIRVILECRFSLDFFHPPQNCHYLYLSEGKNKIPIPRSGAIWQLGLWFGLLKNLFALQEYGTSGTLKLSAPTAQPTDNDDVFL